MAALDFEFIALWAVFILGDALGAIHSTKLSGNFGPKLNGSVRSNRKSFGKTGPPFEVVLFSRSDRLEFWLNGSRPLSVLTGNASMAVFILRTHYPSGRTWANIFGSSGYAYEI